MLWEWGLLASKNIQKGLYSRWFTFLTNCVSSWTHRRNGTIFHYWVWMAACCCISFYWTFAYTYSICLSFYEAYDERRGCEVEIWVIGVIYAADVATWIRGEHRTVEGCYMSEWLHLLRRTAAATMMTIVKMSPKMRHPTSVHFL